MESDYTINTEITIFKTEVEEFYSLEDQKRLKEYNTSRVISCNNNNFQTSTNVLEPTTLKKEIVEECSSEKQLCERKRDETIAISSINYNLQTYVDIPEIIKIKQDNIENEELIIFDDKIKMEVDDNTNLTKTSNVDCCTMDSEDNSFNTNNMQDWHGIGVEKNMNDSKLESCSSDNVKTDLIPCNLCEKFFSTKRAYKVHRAKDHWEKYRRKDIIYECACCSFCTTRKADFNRHRIKHGDFKNLRKLICPKCTYFTYRKGDLDSHISRRHNISPCETRRCNLCDFTTIDKHCFQEHTRSHGREINCNYCEKLFISMEALKVHKRKDHPEKCRKKGVYYECTDCSYSTTNQKHFDRHKIVHGDLDNRTKFECPHCAYVTYRKGCIIRHMTGKHSKVFDSS